MKGARLKKDCRQSVRRTVTLAGRGQQYEHSNDYVRLPKTLRTVHAAPLDEKPHGRRAESVARIKRTGAGQFEPACGENGAGCSTIESDFGNAGEEGFAQGNRRRFSEP